MATTTFRPAPIRWLAASLMLAALYSALYGLLVSEDNALLLGALLVFGMIAAAMTLTRNVDWYRVGKQEPGRADGAVTAN